MQFLIALSIFFFTLFIGSVSSSQTTPITITQVSNLDFGTAFTGDPEKEVDRGTTETAENASFLITGEPGATFNVTRPTTIWITHPTSGDRIRVRRFRARPNRSGRIRNNGERLMFVGATRNAIPLDISPGQYSGTFTVTVVY